MYFTRPTTQSTKIENRLRRHSVQLMLQQLKPDLIVLDVAMPGMNGVEAASVLKRMMPDVPIVWLTMYKELVGLLADGGCWG